MSLIICLQISHKDVQAGMELCQLCADIEDRYEPRDDCEFWIVYSKKVTPDTAARMATILGSKFQTRTFSAKNKGEGFPYGAYMLWLSTMVEAGALYKKSVAYRETFNGIFTFESDCVPMRRDWIDALTNEWDKHVADNNAWNRAHKDEKQQLECMGHLHQAETVHAHINGNAIFKPDLLDRKIIGCHEFQGWDFAPENREFFLRTGKDTNLITQLYSRATIDAEEIAFVKKNGITPAILHGIKDGSARKHVRNLLGQSS